MLLTTFVVCKFSLTIVKIKSKSRVVLAKRLVLNLEIFVTALCLVGKNVAEHVL